MWRILPSLILLCGATNAAELFHDDFSYYPPGWLSTPVGTLNPAIQEYHYLAHRGVPLGPWANAIAHLDAWVVSDEDGKPYLEQQLTRSARQFANPILITGDPEWGDYSVQVRVRPLALDDLAGVVFRYHTNRHYYLFALTGGNTAALRLHMPLETGLRVPAWKNLAEAPFSYDTRRYYALKVENEGPRIRAYVDGKLVIEASDSELPQGKAGVTAVAPARGRSQAGDVEAVSHAWFRCRTQRALRRPGRRRHC